MEQLTLELTDDGYRPGFAKRIANPKVFSRKLPQNLAAYDVQQAIALGLPSLSPQERALLQFYISFLNLKKLSEGKTSVWPSNQLTCTLLGISVQTLRRYKGLLEHKGYILRRYDRKNRPLKHGAIDLAPLLCQVRDLLNDIQEKFDAQKAYYHSLEVECSMAYDESAYPLTRERHKHINTKNSFSVPIVPSEKERYGEANRCVSSVLNVKDAKKMIGKSETLTQYFVNADGLDVESSQVWNRLNKSVKELFPSGSNVFRLGKEQRVVLARRRLSYWWSV